MTKKDMKWQATNSCKVNSVSWNCIQFGHFARYDPHFGMKFYFVAQTICYFVFFLRNSCVTSHKNIEIILKVRLCGIFSELIAFEDFFTIKNLSGETLCKLVQIFPPKVLVFKGEFFISHILIDFQLNYLLQTNENSKPWFLCTYYLALLTNIKD